MLERLSVQDASSRLEDPATVFLDVREPHEVRHCSIEGATPIPLREIPMRALDELKPGQPVVVYCHHGGRSLMAAQMLVNMGFESVANLEGGIDAWSMEVDSSIPRY